MIGVLTLFGEIDLQPVLSNEFLKENISFIKENCVTSVQLMNDIDEHFKETDVVLIYSDAVNMDTLPELVTYIRNAEPKMRIILMLNGNADMYLRKKIEELRKIELDLFFDDNGFDPKDLINLIKCGKLSKQKPKGRHKESGFQEIEEPEEPVKEGKASFVMPQGNYVISVVNSMHGAGATYTALNLAKYLAFQNFKTCLLDLSGTDNFDKKKIDKIEVFSLNDDIEKLKKKYNVIVIDAGTPYEVGKIYDEYRIYPNYPVMNFRYILDSNIKLVMGSTDWWNIGKLMFFMNNYGWRGYIDESFLFLVPENSERLKKMYPKINVMSRTDDYRESILELLWEAETK